MNEAKKDITEIFDFLSKNINEYVAIKIFNNLHKRIDELSFFPFRYPLFNKYRKMKVDYYDVFYMVFNDIVLIERIIHSKRKFY